MTLKQFLELVAVVPSVMLVHRTVAFETRISLPPSPPTVNFLSPDAAAPEQQSSVAPSETSMLLPHPALSKLRLMSLKRARAPEVNTNLFEVADPSPKRDALPAKSNNAPSDTTSWLLIALLLIERKAAVLVMQVSSPETYMRQFLESDAVIQKSPFTAIELPSSMRNTASDVPVPKMFGDVAVMDEPSVT